MCLLALRNVNTGRFSVACCIVALLILSAACEDPVRPSRFHHRGIEGRYTGLITITRGELTLTEYVVFDLRLPDPNDLSQGVYSHRLDTLNPASVVNNDMCDVPLGEWYIQNLGIVLSPQFFTVATECDPRLVPDSRLPDDSVNVVSFAIRTVNVQPLDVPIGDSLILYQASRPDGASTMIELTLTELF